MATFSMNELVELERRGWDALCSAQGAAFYRDLMTEDAVMVLANGMVMDRDAVAASLDQAPPWSRYEIVDERLLPIGDQAAALVYRAIAHRDEDDRFEALMSSVYRLVEDRPRLVLYQQTPV